MGRFCVCRCRACTTKNRQREAEGGTWGGDVGGCSLGLSLSHAWIIIIYKRMYVHCFIPKQTRRALCDGLMLPLPRTASSSLVGLSAARRRTRRGNGKLIPRAAADEEESKGNTALQDELVRLLRQQTAKARGGLCRNAARSCSGLSSSFRKRRNSGSRGGRRNGYPQARAAGWPSTHFGFSRSTPRLSRPMPPYSPSRA